MGIRRLGQLAIREALWRLTTRPLTVQHVVWAHRLLLNREPESSDRIAECLDSYETVDQLRDFLLSSPEFQLRNARQRFTQSRNIVIKELDCGLRIFVDLSDLFIGAKVVLGLYEVAELEFVRRIVASGQVVLDIGANVGFYTLNLASIVGPTGAVYAFEPLGHNLELLRRSVSENRLDHRVTVQEAAVSDRSGETDLLFLSSTPTSGGSHLFDGSTPPVGHEVERVRVIALDDYAVRRPVSFVKIDIEGAEPLAIRGARTLLAEDRPIILSELNPEALHHVSGYAPDQFVEEVERIGYVCMGLTSDGQVSPVRITAQDRLQRSVVFLPSR
jgi:FkbM family methyltransferase